MDWQKREDLQGRIEGVLIPGNRGIPWSTYRWNRWFLRTFMWLWVPFEVSVEDARRGYQVGFAPLDGPPEIKVQTYHDRKFIMRLGRESCVFFALQTIEGTEREIRLSHGDPMPAYYGARLGIPVH